MKILVLNAGSSSLKYQLFDMVNDDVMAQWVVERIGIDWSFVKHKAKGNKSQIDKNLNDHKEALSLVVDLLINWELAVISSLEEINAVGHRVVHGWEDFKHSVLITPDVKQKISDLSALAPLHNPANLMWIDAIEVLLPGVPNIAVFDTAFHQTMEASSYIYPIPYKFYEKYKIRKYWFHGTSHKYVSHRAAEILNKDIKDLNVIVCHIWNGASVTAIKGGKVIDTSMWFTPLEGLVMGTRSGDLDPAIAHFLMEKENMSSKELDTMLNKESWVLGISEISSDMREIEDGHIAGNERETLTMDIYNNRLMKYIGAYVAILDGCDAIVFTAGAMENSPYMRKLLADRMSWLWVKLDEEANDFRGKERIISTKDSSTTLMVVPTNEEFMIAQDTYQILNEK